MMNKLAGLGRFIGTWYVSTVLLAAVGLVIGSAVFFYAYPGKPKIGMIEIPFTIINDRSAFEIGAMLDYVRDDASIKGVVISLNTPGGGAAPSEELFFEIVRLREKKPVVMVMEDLVASGGFMMAMGANYTMAKPSTFVGGVGVILSPLPPILPRQPSDRIGVTGPFKLDGGTRRHYVVLTDQLRQAFASIVLTERGAKLRMTRNEVLEGNIYSGVEAMQVGLIDGLGGQTDAIEKAASLAGIANYSLVDVNTEVSRIFNQKLDRINGPARFESALSGGLGAAELLALLDGQGAGGPGEDFTLLKDLIAANSQSLLTLPPPGGIGADPSEALPDFPLSITGPKAYYLYVGPSE
ncbi:MAG: S49 family peptidase [Chloroflexi bacterium]|nr:S49 family peptidase [Chloroflexota bacterium]